MQSIVDTFINLFSKLQTAFSYDVICLIFLFAYKKEICAINSQLKIFFLPICCVSQIKLNLSLAIESAHFYGFREPESSNQFLLKNHAVQYTVLIMQVSEFYYEREERRKNQPTIQLKSTYYYILRVINFFVVF